MKVYNSGSANFVVGMLCCVVTTLILSLANASHSVFSVYDVLVELDTRGRMKVARTNITDWSSEGSSENTEVFLRVKEIRLLDKNGIEVKSFNLDSSDINHFEMTEFETTHYAGVSANGKSMVMVSLGDAQDVIELRFYIFTEPGTVHPDVDPLKVSLGDVRVDVVVNNFGGVCSTCSDVAALEVDLDVHGKADVNIKTKLVEKDGSSTDFIRVPKGAVVVITDRFSLDGVWEVMPGGYPQLEATGGASAGGGVQLTARFPAVQDSAVFGFTVQPMKIGQNENEVNSPQPSVGKDSSGSGRSHARGSVVAAIVAFTAFSFLM